MDNTKKPDATPPAEQPKLSGVSPIQEYYLKKALVRKQLDVEFAWLSTQTEVSKLSLKAVQDNTLLVSYIITNILMEFPMIKEQDDDFWGTMTSLFIKMNGITTNNAFERDAAVSKTEKTLRKLKATCKWIMASAIKTTQQDKLPMELQQLIQNPHAQKEEKPAPKASADNPTTDSGAASGTASAAAATSTSEKASTSKKGLRLYARVLIVRDVPGKKSNAHIYIIRTQDAEKIFLTEHKFHEFQELQRNMCEELPDQIVPDAPMGGLFQSKKKKSLLQTANMFLYTLLSSDKFRNSKHLRDFLTNEKYIPKLAEGEQSIVAAYESARKAQDEKTKAIEERLAKRIGELYTDAYHALDELTQIRGFTVFISLLKSTDSIGELPPHFQSVFELLRLQLGHYIFRTYHASLDADQGIKSIKRIYRFMPFTALGVLAGLASSQAIIKMSIDILLARPFGASNLLQRIALSGLEKENPEQRIKDLQQSINNDKFCQKLKNYVYKEITSPFPSPVATPATSPAASPATPGSPHMSNSIDWIRSVLNDVSFDPKLDKAEVKKLTPEQLTELHSYLAMHVHLRDNKKLVALFGDSDFIGMIKKVLPKLTFLIVEFNQSLNMRELTDGLKHFMRDLINIASINNPNMEAADIAAYASGKKDMDFGVPNSPFPLARAKSEDVCLEQFLELIKNFERNLFTYLKDLFSRDDSIPQIRKLLVWVFFLFNFMRRGNTPNPVDVVTLADLHLDDAQKKTLFEEVQACEEYEEQKKELLQKRMERKMKKLAKIARNTAAANNKSLELDEDEDFYVQLRGGLKPPQTTVLDKISRPFALAVVNAFQQSFSTK